MKELPCLICGKIHIVDEKCKKVTCAECYLAGEPPTREENGIVYRRPEAWEKIIGEYKPKIDIWRSAQKMRNEGLSTREIAKRLSTSQRSIIRHTESLKV